MSFHEEKALKILGILRMRIVPPDSATIGHHREVLGSIPSDHRHMAKFKTSEDTGFCRVQEVLRRWIVELEEGRQSQFMNLGHRE
jgi:hypothetical protein